MGCIMDKPVNIQGERAWHAMPVRGAGGLLAFGGWRLAIAVEGVRGRRRPARGAVAVWCVWLLACVLLLASGVVYKVLAGHLDRLDSFISLPVPLKNIPEQIGDWRGRDVPLSESVLKVAGNDDYLNRLYVNRASDQWANVYIAYSANPRTMRGHRPQVCYPSAGWQHDGTDHIKVTSLSGREMPCLLHRFHRASNEVEEIVVLNFYVLNGEITDDEGTFSGTGWRLPNISGNIARYVAQVQVSSVLENSVRAAASEFAEVVMDYLPDAEGVVKVATPIIDKGRQD